MDYNNFLKWCTLKEPKLREYIINSFITECLIFVWIILLFFFMILFSSVIGSGGFYSVINVFFSLFFSILITTKIAIIFESPMSRVEFLSCLLNKISKEIELCLGEGDQKELIQDIKVFKRYSSFQFTFPSKDLFKDKNKMEANFFHLLKDLPNRIYFSINEEILNLIDVESIRLLAFYIYTDDQKKVEILNRLTKENPNSKEMGLRLAIDLRKLYNNNLFKLAGVTVLLLLLFYFIAYRFLNIKIDTVATQFVVLFSTFLYLIFKK